MPLFNVTVTRSASVDVVIFAEDDQAAESVARSRTGEILAEHDLRYEFFVDAVAEISELGGLPEGYEATTVPYAAGDFKTTIGRVIENRATPGTDEYRRSVELAGQGSLASDTREIREQLGEHQDFVEVDD